MSLRAFQLVLLFLSQLAWAQDGIPLREMETLRAFFDAGKYEDTLLRSRELLASEKLNEEQQAFVFRLAGLAAFNLEDQKTASEFWLQLLFINPDYVLDPFAVPPPAIQFFEELRTKNADALNLVRKQLKEKEAANGESSEAKGPAPLKPPTLELPPPPIDPVPERPNFLLPYVPFGMAQFKQGRPVQGIALALTQGALALTSIVGFWRTESLYQTQTVVLEDRLGGDVVYSVRGIPENRVREAEFWSGIKYASAIGFYVSYATGVIDGLVHQSAATSEAVLPNSSPSPPNVGSSLRLRLVPHAGGAGASLTLNF